jgi:hypothetical protein
MSGGFLHSSMIIRRLNGLSLRLDSWLRMTQAGDNRIQPGELGFQIVDSMFDDPLETATVEGSQARRHKCLVERLTAITQKLKGFTGFEVVKKSQPDITRKAGYGETGKVFTKKVLEGGFSGRGQPVDFAGRAVALLGDRLLEPAVLGHASEQVISGRFLKVGAVGQAALDELKELVAVHFLLSQEAEEEEFFIHNCNLE